MHRRSPVSTKEFLVSYKHQYRFLQYVPLKQVYSILKHVVLIFSRNGRWRSVWTIREDGGQVEVTGILKVQVHYYEDGNVQLVSSKEIKETITKSVSIVAVVIWNVLLLL